MNKYAEADAQAIILFCRQQGIPEIAIAGILSNMDCESSMCSTNMQNGYNKKYNITDEEYTKQVDEGVWEIPAGFPNAGATFKEDKVGYGLCQWTSAGRKTAMYDFIRALGTSIGDRTSQLMWMMEEFHNKYKKVYEALLKCTTAYDAGVLIVMKYEVPGSVLNPETVEATKKTRGDHAEELYKKYFGGGNQTMSNSPLVDYVKISPNRTSPRNHTIDTITIHCVVGQVTVERLGDIFAPTSRNASSNYGIGYDGKVGMYVEEKDRSWCSSSPSNDHRAITIEVASDTTAPYKITDAAYKKLVLLVADICQRNDIQELKWKGDKNLIGQIDKQNMTVHRWFAKKSCPGDYLYNLHSQITNEVNQILNGSKNPQPSTITMIKHTVAKGENLTKIANRYDTTVNAILAANPSITNPNRISVGQVLNIPAKANAMPTTYTVVAGDTLSKIAKKVGNGCTWQQLAKLNNIKAPYVIRKGQVLKLPS